MDGYPLGDLQYIKPDVGPSILCPGLNLPQLVSCFLRISYGIYRGKVNVSFKVRIMARIGIRITCLMRYIHIHIYALAV